jgi:glutathione synthase/RimK-type ligase-like ATP-grasp enzyme
VLVLGGMKSQDFFDQVAKRNVVAVDYDCAGYGDLIFHIDGLATKVLNAKAENRDVADYSLAYFKSRDHQVESALAVAIYLHFKGRPFIDHELRESLSCSKLTEYMKLATFDLPLPPSICAGTELLKGRYAELIERLGSPFVMKEIASDRGKYNYLIKDAREFKRILSDALPEHIFVAQKYIENDGFLRVYVTGKEAALAIQRVPHPHDNPLKAHLNKPAGSANASLVDVADLPLEVRELSVKAAACMQRQIAGVDLIKDKRNGEWYILEVNNGPQLRTGSFLDEKVGVLAKFFDKELER